ARIACFPIDEHSAIAHLPLPMSTFIPQSEAWLVASQTLHNRTPGRFPTKPSNVSSQIFYPLLTAGGAVGVIGLQFDNPPDDEQEGLIQTLTHQTAIALEREVLRKDAARTQLLAESERLYNTLLNSVSHELRTPLATIAGASSSLMEIKTPEKQFWRLLVGDIFSAAQQLNRLVKNLLDMSRLESGRLRLNLSWCDAADLVSVVLRRLSSDLSTHQLVVEIQPDLPLVRIDFTLMEQALTNILLNTSQYAPAGTKISIQAQAGGQHLFFVIEDEGPGFPPYALNNIFDKFFRLPGSRSGGTGLGLSITRGFIEAHGGSITAENRDPNGARFTICLPAREKPGAMEEAS
ncbi:MAG: two-component sensor histidine kinase, partial [Calditrichaeota bacterium]